MRTCVYCSVGNCQKCVRRNCNCQHLKRQLGDIVQNDKKPVLEFKWGVLPTQSRGMQTIDKFAESMKKLKEKPGDWASLAVYPSHSGAHSASRALKKGGYAADFEFTTRREGEKSILWARFVGKTKARA